MNGILWEAGAAAETRAERGGRCRAFPGRVPFKNGVSNDRVPRQLRMEGGPARRPPRPWGSRCLPKPSLPPQTPAPATLGPPRF